jgi:hypothetical protein
VKRLEGLQSAVCEVMNENETIGARRSEVLPLAALRMSGSGRRERERERVHSHKAKKKKHGTHMHP